MSPSRYSRPLSVAAATVALVALPAAPALAHDGPEHYPVEACGTTLTIHEDLSQLNEKFDETGFKGTGIITVHVQAEDGREATFKTAGQIRIEVVGPGVFAIRETGRRLFFPTSDQQAEELTRVGLPQFGIFAGQLSAVFTGVPFGPGSVEIVEVPNNVRSACHLLR